MFEEEIPIAITATISVAKLTIKFIASYVTMAAPPFLLDWGRPLLSLLFTVLVNYTIFPLVNRLTILIINGSFK